MSSGTIARRYSAALADVVLEGGDVETVKAELANLGELFQSNGELQTVFSNPAITHANKEKVLESLISKTKPSKTTANFVRVLLQNSRLMDLAEINERFAAELETRGGLVSAEIISARELPQNERADFESSLAKLTGKIIKANYLVDPEIIGGVVTRIGSTVYDGSVKTKLENFKEQLVNG